MEEYMNNINWMTVIISIVMSVITVYIIVFSNLYILSKRLNEFQKDTIEACTTEVANYVNKKYRT